MSGAGPDVRGRFLISAAVISRHTDPLSQASDVVLDFDFQGDEIAESTICLHRRVWADDPDDLTSPMHYEVKRVDMPEEPNDPAMTGLRPSAHRVSAVLDGSSAHHPDGIEMPMIEDLLSADGHGMLLKRRTIYAALADLSKAGLAAKAETGAGWRSTCAQVPASEAQSDR